MFNKLVDLLVPKDSPWQLEFEWDENKDRRNVQNHGISFTTASSVFYDPDRIEMYDLAHSDTEDRYYTIGVIGANQRCITVIYTIRDSNVIRMISARSATRRDREVYYDRSQKD